MQNGLLLLLSDSRRIFSYAEFINLTFICNHVVIKKTACTKNEYFKVNKKIDLIWVPLKRLHPFCSRFNLTLNCFRYIPIWFLTFPLSYLESLSCLNYRYFNITSQHGFSYLRNMWAGTDSKFIFLEIYSLLFKY